MKKFEQQNNQETISEFEDLRGIDLSEKNLKSVSVEILATTDFDMETKWPKEENLPEGFNPKILIEESKNPGLGIKKLHAQGIDGRGIRVAIIDQKLLGGHEEYKNHIIDYSEYGTVKDEEVSMHGPAVASLLVGKNCGVAPGAELIYKATPFGREFEWRAKALMDIIESNKTIESNKKIRIVSCSIGYTEQNPEPGLEQWIKAIKNAAEAGIIVVDVGKRLGINFTGGGSLDKEDFEKYNLWLHLKNRSDIDVKNHIVVPSDYRTMASWKGADEYMYTGKGGLSWSVPYLAGLFALALQVNPDLSQQKLVDLVNKNTSANKKGLRVINPREFIEAVKK
jgi:hypothetical protein